jgi:hypothetical protein
MKDLKDNLTNENLGKKFKSQFDLVNYAIRIAENMVRSGRDLSSKTDVQNPAMQVLNVIVKEEDFIEDVLSKTSEGKDLEDINDLDIQVVEMTKISERKETRQKVKVH